VTCPHCRDEDIGLALEQRLAESYRPNVATGGALWRLTKAGKVAEAPRALLLSRLISVVAFSRLFRAGG
jgi:hypothetical protein